MTTNGFGHCTFALHIVCISLNLAL